MKRVRHRVLVVLMVVAAVATACGSSDDPVATAPGTATNSGASTFATLAHQWPDESVPLATALSAFAYVIGPLPGVETPSGGDEKLLSGSGPLRWVRGHWAALSQEQRDAVDRYVSVEPNDAAGSGVLLAALVPPAVLAADGDDVDERAIVAIIEQLLGRLEAELGRPLGIPVELHKAPSFVSGKGAMFAEPADAAGGWAGVPVKCIVTIGKNGLANAADIGALGAPSTGLIYMLAHELFHCYSFTVGEPGAWVDRPDWVMEGMATWAGETISGGTTGSEYWETWLQAPFGSLFSWTYPAVGFWAHLDEHGGSLWLAAFDILAASDNGSASAYGAALTIADADMLASWGPGFFRDAQYAPAFDQNGPGIPDVKAPVEDKGTVADGTSLTMAAPLLGAEVYRAELEAEVVVFGASSHGMAQLPDGVIITLPAAEVVCTDLGAGCTCPEGSPGSATIFRQTIPGEFRAGLTGHLQGGELSMTGWDLEDFCEEPPVPACMIGDWISEEYRAPGQSVIGGLATLRMSIDRTGRGEVVFNPDVPINARLDTSDGIAPWVKLVFSGSYLFTMTRNGTTGEVLGGDAIVTHFAFLEGQWIPGPEPTSLVPVPGSATSSFICEGDRLILRAPGGVSEFELSRVES
ncbi:MAG: hypothetical protein GY720_11280 [bacterium]|nr:hypothetical protein [bacterium]